SRSAQASRSLALLQRRRHEAQRELCRVPAEPRPSHRPGEAMDDWLFLCLARRLAPELPGLGLDGSASGAAAARGDADVRAAEPLVWTTSRPVVTRRPFDQRVTGAEFWGSLFPSSGSLTYALYGQLLPALPSVAKTQNAADNSAGARLEFAALRDWSAGASY